MSEGATRLDGIDERSRARVVRYVRNSRVIDGVRCVGPSDAPPISKLQFLFLHLLRLNRR